MAVEIDKIMCQDTPYRRTTDCRAYDSANCPKTCWYAKQRGLEHDLNEDKLRKNRELGQ